MKIVVFSDLHGDWVTGGLERFDEASRALDQIKEFIAAEKPDATLFLGDATDPDVDSPLCHRTIARLVEFGLAVDAFWIDGNHDVIEDGRGSHTLMALAKAGLRVVSRPWSTHVGDVGFVFLPYPSIVDRYDPAAFVRETAESYHRNVARLGAFRFRAWVVAGHMTRVRGCGPGSETTDMARGADIEFPVDECALLGDKVVMLNGHFHARKIDGPVLVPGSVMRLTHGEEQHTPGFLVVEV